MLHSTTRLIPLIFIAALALAACSDDAQTNNGTLTDGGGANNGGQDAVDDTTQDDTGADAAEQDTGADVAADTTEQDTSSGDPLWVPDFTYLNTTRGNGVSVNIISGRIGKIENSDALTEDLTDEEIAGLEADILTEETRNKMLDGWDCGDATDAEGEEWIFEARVLNDAGDHERVTTNISGCVLDSSTEPDAARVQEIIQHLDDLRADHFAPR